MSFWWLVGLFLASPAFAAFWFFLAKTVYNFFVEVANAIIDKLEG